MSFFTRVSNGWKITVHSFEVLKENKQLLIFPVLSAIAMVLVMGSFAVTVFAAAGWDADAINIPDGPIRYLYALGFYFINYFVIVFFNTALVHCTHLYFSGEEPTVQKGLQFSASRIRHIAEWALFAAFVGTLLKIVQENVGWLGKIITGIIGIVWSVATFFVVPVIAYENVSPWQAVKRSGQIMNQKWGESLTANFSLGLIQFFAIITVLFVAFLLTIGVHPALGIAAGIAGVLAIAAIGSAVKTIFISAVYHNINGSHTQHFNQQMIDGLFTEK